MVMMKKIVACIGIDAIVLVDGEVGIGELTSGVNGKSIGWRKTN